MLFLAQAMGRTLVMTVDRLRRRLPVRLADRRRPHFHARRCCCPCAPSLVLYVEFFRRIPFLVILFIVLFLIAGRRSRAPRCSPSRRLGLPALDRLFCRNHPRRPRIGAAPADRGGAALNFSFAGRSLVMVILPQAWQVILPPAVAFMVMFIKDTSLASQIGVVELTFAGKMLINRGFSPVLVFGTILIALFRPVLSAQPLRRVAGEAPCIISRFAACRPRYGSLPGPEGRRRCPSTRARSSA